jgi:flagellar biosynthesis GTPase FlhF
LPSEPTAPPFPLFAEGRVRSNHITQKAATRWRVGSVLESTGLLPVYAQQLVEGLCERHGSTPPGSLAKEIEVAAAALTSLWRATTNANCQCAHVFIGAPGSGKTTCLCQWLARITLLEGKSARVWRLDGRTANHGESLSVYAEILGVPLDRFVPDTPPPEGDHLFIDLPGVNYTDPKAVQDLARQVTHLPVGQIHLVLNAAYETEVLFSQIRAFAGVPLTDLIFTHLDEEPQWGKLWNFVLGTNYTIGCLGAGQNVPGDFQLATPEIILNRQFLRK